MGPTNEVRLSWTGRDQAFRGGEPGGPSVILDGTGEEGPSPTTALLLSLAACMGIDIRHILEKSRVSVTGVEVEVTGTRAEDHPRRFESVSMLFTVRGPGEEDEAPMERALSLSRSTYCSVLHTLRSDLELDLTIRRS
ncbi:MAG: OsmC family protein [Gemmatimonadota bacterium]